MTSPADLPDNIDALKAIILASQAKMTEQDRVIEPKEDRIFRLEKLLVDFKRALYGATSEKGHLLPGSRLHANDERGAKTSANGWTSCLPSSVSLSHAALNMPAVTARQALSKRPQSHV